MDNTPVKHPAAAAEDIQMPLEAAATCQAEHTYHNPQQTMKLRSTYSFTRHKVSKSRASGYHLTSVPAACLFRL